MASSDYITEVVIKPDIEEVEIESIPVDMPCETVETTIDYGEGQPMIALQPLPEPGREEIILQTQEEIVCSEDPLSVYDQMQVPDQEIYVETSPGPSRKGGRKGKRGGRFKNDNFMSDGTETKARKWEQKQVQIKTLEGEFSVTMWASGTDDGKIKASIMWGLFVWSTDRPKYFGVLSNTNSFVLSGGYPALTGIVARWASRHVRRSVHQHFVVRYDPKPGAFVYECCLF